jgi:hypothetical protein
MTLHRQKGQVTPDDNLEDGIRESQNGSPASHDQYTIAWICALPIEMAAARAMLDDIHEDLPRHSNDTNTYTLGSAFSHFRLRGLVINLNSTISPFNRSRSPPFSPFPTFTSYFIPKWAFPTMKSELRTAGYCLDNQQIEHEYDRPTHIAPLGR